MPFTITVQITAFGVLGPLVQATQLRATYRNRKRINLTRCVAAPSYDAAATTVPWWRSAPPARCPGPGRAPPAAAGAAAPLAGDHHVEAERPPGRGEEVLRPGLSRAGVGEPAGRERARIQPARDPVGGEQAPPRLQAGPGQVLGQRDEGRPGGHRRRAGVAELAVAERELEVAGVQRGAAAGAAEHAAAPARGQLDRDPVGLEAGHDTLAAGRGPGPRRPPAPRSRPEPRRAPARRNRAWKASSCCGRAHPRGGQRGQAADRAVDAERSARPAGARRSGARPAGRRRWRRW